MKKRRRMRAAARYRLLKLLVAASAVVLIGILILVSVITDRKAKQQEAERAFIESMIAKKSAEAISESDSDSSPETTESSKEVTTQESAETTSETATEEQITSAETTPVPTTALDVTTVDYSSVVFVGDSRTLSMSHGGTYEYGLVPDDAVCATWGGQLIDESALQNARNAAATGRPVAIFWYGVNDVQVNPDRDNVDQFIANYQNVLNAYLDGNPTGQICIVSILNTSVNEKDHYDGQEENIIRYNEALKNLCSEKGYVYLDATGLMEGEEGIIPGDNIHFTEEFYRDLFLPFIVRSLGLA